MSIILLVAAIALTLLSSFNTSVQCWLSSNEILKIWTPILTSINILVLIALYLFVRDYSKQSIEKQITINKNVCVFKHKYDMFYKNREVINSKYYNMMEDTCSEKLNGRTNENVFDEFANAMYRCCKDFYNLLPCFHNEDIYKYWMDKINEYKKRYVTKPVIEFAKYSGELSQKLDDFFTILENQILNFEIESKE
jgi:hypothetical protein